ncbi:MAG: TetR/AcrR family transcriptional regulator [Anaerolineae bacterium]
MKKVPQAEAQPELTPKAQETRQRIFDTAVRLFMEKGYEETTMRDIAAAAGCSLGLTYRYFASKEDLVLALYRQLSVDTKARIAELPPAPLGERFQLIMTDILERVTPYRAAWSGIFGGAMNPDSPIAVLGARTADIRHEMRGVFTEMIATASDAPKKPDQIAALGMLLYVAHLMTLLFWISDRTPGCSATHNLLDFSKDMLGLIKTVLFLPVASKGMARLAGIVESVFDGNADK